MECVIQSSMFYSFYLFLFILLYNVDRALVSDSNAYIWISSCTQMFELYSNIRIYVQFWRNVFLVHALEKWRLRMIQLHQELVNASKKKTVFYWEGRGCLCWAWRNARGFSWTNVTKHNGGVRASKKAILAWPNNLIVPKSLNVRPCYNMGFVFNFSLSQGSRYKYIQTRLETILGGLFTLIHCNRLVSLIGE